MEDIRVETLLATRGARGSNNGLLTFRIQVPYYVWVELLTHKRLSRNASSARAQSIPRHVDMGYYLPRHFYAQGEGMEGGYDLPWDAQEEARRIWVHIWTEAERAAKRLAELGVAKEQANRVLPTFKVIHGIVTGTEDAWQNFLALRTSPKADRAMQELAGIIKHEINHAAWRYDIVHAPLLEEVDTSLLEAAARIARVSYTGTGGKTSEIKLAQRLLKDRHLSPFEHIAEWTDNPRASAVCSKPEDLHGTCGWQSLRATYEWMEEFIKDGQSRSSQLPKLW